VDRASNRKLWAKRVQRWRESSLTAREYAAETGVNQHTLTTWASRLTREAARAAGHEVLNRRTKAGRATTPPRIARVEFAEAVPPAQPDEKAADFVVHIGEVRVRVPASFDASALTRLLGVLGASR